MDKEDWGGGVKLSYAAEGFFLPSFSVEQRGATEEDPPKPLREDWD